MFQLLSHFHFLNKVQVQISLGTIPAIFLNGYFPRNKNILADNSQEIAPRTCVYNNGFPHKKILKNVLLVFFQKNLDLQ